MDFLVREWWIRRTRKSIVRLKQQAVGDFRYATFGEPSKEKDFTAVLKNWGAVNGRPQPTSGDPRSKRVRSKIANRLSARSGAQGAPQSIRTHVAWRRGATAT
ncbi:hypothetical protein Rcae01_03392 [Novipirellula caenicola]|uniref:Uncharacterized protein n=1 Tax=Novipirellula caenicola TaxID=1536901 RepID=A0ABP9VRZ0_9BACT